MKSARAGEGEDLMASAEEVTDGVGESRCMCGGCWRVQREVAMGAMGGEGGGEREIS